MEECCFYSRQTSTEDRVLVSSLLLDNVTAGDSFDSYDLGNDRLCSAERMNSTHRRKRHR